MVCELFYPVFAWIKTSNHCVQNSVFSVEETGLQDLANQGGSKMRVRYTLWIGNDKYVERTLKLRVPTNSSFYTIMELAGNIDSKYR